MEGTTRGRVVRDAGAGTEIYYHTPSATLVSIFLGICSTYLVTAVHLLKRICGANIPEICTHISVLCKCIHTKGYCMHTSTKYPPIYPSLTMYSDEGCLVHTYSKYSPTYTYCVLNYRTPTSFPYFGVKLSCVCFMFACRKKNNDL